jgi:hypothetical protein
MAKGKEIKRPALNSSKRFEVKEQIQYINYDLLRPLFSLKDMAYNSKFCISRRTSNDRSSILKKLLMISQLTWKKIISEKKDGNGFEAIPRGSFTASLPTAVTPEVDELLVFRYSEAGRIAGYRDNDIYHIVLVGEHLYKH